MPVFKVQPQLGRGQKTIVIGRDGTRAQIMLGRLAEFGPQREVWLDVHSEHVVAIVGKRGSGKTHTLGALVEGLSTASERVGIKDTSVTAREHAIVLFDTLNLFQWVDLPLAEAGGPDAERQRKLLAKWKLQPMPLKPTFWHPLGSEPATPTSMPFSINPADMNAQDWGRLFDVDTTSEPMGQLVTQIFMRLARRPGTTAATYSIESMLSLLRTDREIQADYAPETIRALRQRLTVHLYSSLFDSNVPDWTSALKPGHVSVFLLGRVPEDLRSVLVFLVIRRLLEVRSAASERAKHALITGSRQTEEEVPPTWLVIDEAQNILPSRNATAANDILTRYVREGRNFGLSLAITTQQPSSIDARVMAQVDTLVAHNLTVRGDISYILSNLKSAEPASIQSNSKEVGISDALRLLEPGQCLISAVDSPRLLFCEVRPRVSLHGGFEA